MLLTCPLCVCDTNLSDCSIKKTNMQRVKDKHSRIVVNVVERDFIR